MIGDELADRLFFFAESPRCSGFGSGMTSSSSGISIEKLSKGKGSGRMIRCAPVLLMRRDCLEAISEHDIGLRGYSATSGARGARGGDPSDLTDGELSGRISRGKGAGPTAFHLRCVSSSLSELE